VIAVLIVEDDALVARANARLLERYLRDLHVEVAHARDVDEAITLMKAVRFACVLTDWRMPMRVGAPETVDAGRYVVTHAVFARVPVAVLSGSAPEACGAPRFEKPVDGKVLAAWVREQIGRAA
jgi:CheY-like chemotaxis protein